LPTTETKLDSAIGLQLVCDVAIKKQEAPLNRSLICFFFSLLVSAVVANAQLAFGQTESFYKGKTLRIPGKNWKL
jgi:hypothetical protein